MKQNLQITALLVCSIPVFMVAVSPVRAQEAFCTMEAAGAGKSSSVADDATVPTAGEYKALYIYVRFRDDTGPSRRWPDTLSVAPDFADSILAASPNPASYPGGVFPEHTMTRYFFDQSDPADH